MEIILNPHPKCKKWKKIHHFMGRRFKIILCITLSQRGLPVFSISIVSKCGFCQETSVKRRGSCHRFSIDKERFLQSMKGKREGFESWKEKEVSLEVPMISGNGRRRNIHLAVMFAKCRWRFEIWNYLAVPMLQGCLWVTWFAPYARDIHRTEVSSQDSGALIYCVFFQNLDWC